MFNSRITIGQIIIGKLTAHGPARIEPLQARLRAERLLQAADLMPAGFPPGAILFLRRAVATQPVALGSFRLRPEWEREMRGRLGEMYRRAVRPSRGVVPPKAEAVLFADEAEWMACLGVAVSRRETEYDWCRQALMRAPGLAVSRTPARAWMESPRSVPATLVYLACWGRTAEVLQLLSEDEAEALAEAVAAEWNVPRPIAGGRRQSASALNTVPASDEPERIHHASAGKATVQPAVASALPAGTADTVSIRARAEAAIGETVAVAPPWQRWLPCAESACAQLPPATQGLLALAVAIFHAPATARSGQFAREVSDWLDRARLPAPTATPTPVQSGSIVLPAFSNAAGSRAGRDDPSAQRVKATKIEVEAPPPSKKEIRGAESDCRKTYQLAQAVAEENQTAEAGPLWFGLEGQATQFGGVLYLLNLFLHAGLPECFDEQCELSRHISGWGLAELLGRALLGEIEEADGDDPLWAMLARLDGRQPGESPAAEFAGNDDFYLPADWIARFVAEEPWAIARAGDRLICRHRTGDLVIADCALAGGGATERLEEVIEHYRARGIVVRTEDEFSEPPQLPSWAWLEKSPQWPQLSPPLRRWMVWTFPFLHHLLVRALGDEARDRRVPAQTLLRKPGRLYCTATHVDLVMTLDRISLPVRCAGLDADPGWVRDLMRVVKFHFE